MSATQPKLVRTAKSGILMHAPADAGKAVGGSAPNELLVKNGELYAANANNDTVSVLNAASLVSAPVRLILPDHRCRQSRYRPSFSLAVSSVIERSP